MFLQQTRGVEDVDWPRESDDGDLERKMLQDVAQYLANSAESGAYFHDGRPLHE